MGKVAKEDMNVSFYSRSDNMLDTDPLEAIFALNLGEFLSEHLISEELAKKIAKSDRNKTESLKKQLQELISIYSIDNTLSILGFESNDDYVIYNSIAKTVKLMLSLETCNIYLSKKGENKLKLQGSSDSCDTLPNKYIKSSWKDKCDNTFDTKDIRHFVFPMKNNFECIGAIEVTRNISRPLEEEYANLLRITAGLFVTSLGIQKLIDEVKKVLANDVVSTGELQNLRAQLTAIIGDLGDQQQIFVETLASAVDFKRGLKTNSHSKDTAEISRKICHEMGLGDKTTDLVYYAGLLQNIGQITLDEKILNKREKLTDEEWKQLQESPNAGVSLLMNINFLSEVVPYINYKCERWDGTGTPEGLEGNSIPFGSRIISVADAYCALTEDRAHRKAKTKEEALEILKQESGVKWDPTVVDALLKIC